MSEAGEVTVIDAGIGNVRSVARMFEAVDVPVALAVTAKELATARRIVLPGVGAFDAGMAALNRGWRDALDEAALARRIPILGICLGMQLLCRRSEEGVEDGLGWVAADVTRIDTLGDPRLKVPHMGWAEVRPARANPLLCEADGEPRFYHVHSYRAVCDDPSDVIGTVDYGAPFTTAIQRGNIFGVQFHPEKSHRFGKALLRRFAELPC